jgi:fatty-acyl-CoA synthase
MPTHPNPYRQGLDRNAANHVPLTPLSLIGWAADVYPDRCAVVHGPLRRTWAQLRERSVQLASSLAAMEIGEGDTVAQYPPDDRSALRRADVGRGASLHQYPARCCYGGIRA